MDRNPLPYPPQMRNGGSPPTHFSPPLTAAEVAELDAANLDRRRRHETTARETTLADKAHERRQAAVWENALADEANEQRRHESAKLVEPAKELASAKTADDRHRGTLAATTLATKESDLAVDGGDAHPFRDRGLPLPPRKHARGRHRPRRVFRRHGPRAPNLLEPLLCGQRHRPRAPNECGGWA